MSISQQIEETKAFLTDLFRAGEFRGHGYRVDVPMPTTGRYPVGTVEERAELMGAKFEAELKLKELIGDDRVPELHVWSGTEVFAEAYGSPVHFSGDSMPFARPAVYSGEEADKLREPDIFESSLGKIFAIADKLVERYGHEYPVRICDIQSPLDIAALIWDKFCFLTAMLDMPDAVHRLIDKVTHTLECFVDEFKRRYVNVSLVHYPDFWMPPEFGICLSEDEVGSISTRMYEIFSLPYLNRLSARYGGISLHCCAYATHQWDGFLQLDHLVSLNLNTDLATHVKAIDKFSGKVVLLPQGFEKDYPSPLEAVQALFKHAREDTRFFFTCSAPDVEEARRLSDRLRLLLGR